MADTAPSSSKIEAAALKELRAYAKEAKLNISDIIVSALRPDGDDNRDTPLSFLVQHIRYLTDRIGIDCVGFGSDFDGATMSHDLPDCSATPHLLEALREDGYDDEELEKLAYRNWLRVLRECVKPSRPERSIESIKYGT